MLFRSDVLAGGVSEMVAADGKEVAVAPEHEYVQIGPGERNPTGERQRTTVNVVGAVGLHKIREPAGAANAGNGGKLLLPQLPRFDQLEVKREDGEITAAGTPGRMVGGDFLFRQRLAVGAGWKHGHIGRDGGEFSYGGGHNLKVLKR